MPNARTCDLPSGGRWSGSAGRATITHGLVHAMGLTLLWRWGDASDLRYEQSPRAGFDVWDPGRLDCLLAGALFVVAGVLSCSAAGMASTRGDADRDSLCPC